jgi:cephalosporin hydroxylase
MTQRHKPAATCHVVYLSVIVPMLGFMLTRLPFVELDDVPATFQAQLIQHTSNFETVTWMGEPIWQSVPDVWTLQEVIAAVKPALLIETGTYKGGSSLFIAHLFDLIGQGRVITVDIEKLHSLSHPRVTYLIGDSASPAIVSQITTAAREAQGPVMVLLDSDHSQRHVARELEAYAPLVTPGSYLHVQDGVVDTQPMFEQSRPGPLRAIEAFLVKHPEFQVDEALLNKFLITHHPKGWLKRGPQS